MKKRIIKNHTHRLGLTFPRTRDFTDSENTWATTALKILSEEPTPTGILREQTNRALATIDANEEFNGNVTIGKLLIDGLINQQTTGIYNVNITPLGTKVLEVTAESGMSIPDVLKTLEKAGELEKSHAKAEPSVSR